VSKGPRLLVVQPDPLGPISQLGRRFEEVGITMRVVRPYAGDSVAPTLDDDGLVVMGGDMSSLDDEAYPWLEDIRVLMRAAAELGKPTLGRLPRRPADGAGVRRRDCRGRQRDRSRRGGSPLACRGRGRRPVRHPALSLPGGVDARRRHPRATTRRDLAR